MRSTTRNGPARAWAGPPLLSGRPGKQALPHRPSHSKIETAAGKRDGSPEGRALWGPPSEGRVWVGATLLQIRNEDNDN